MALTDTTLNALADHLGTLATHISLHSADPLTTGANELSGGSYARQVASWAAGANGDLTLSATESFSVPAGTVAYVGLWSAVTAGTWRGGFILSASESFAAPGTYNLTALTVAGSSS